jgi:hypothetical protein
MTTTTDPGEQPTTSASERRRSSPPMRNPLVANLLRALLTEPLLRAVVLLAAVWLTGSAIRWCGSDLGLWVAFQGDSTLWAGAA